MKDLKATLGWLHCWGLSKPKVAARLHLLRSHWHWAQSLQVDLILCIHDICPLIAIKAFLVNIWSLLGQGEPWNTREQVDLLGDDRGIECVLYFIKSLPHIIIHISKTVLYLICIRSVCSGRSRHKLQNCSNDMAWKIGPYLPQDTGLWYMLYIIRKLRWVSICCCILHEL